MSMKNTKAEMLEALGAALARAEAAEKGKLNAVKVEKEKVEKKAVESTKVAVEQNIFSVELNNKFRDLQLAIASEETRLQELYGVSSELQKLALVIETGRERQQQIDSENAAKIEEAKTNLENLKTEYSQRKAELQEDHDTTAKRLKTDRNRESEEYQYNLKRSREKENNSWEDEKAARELALTKKEEQAQTILTEAEKKIDYIKSLEAKVEGIPELIEAEKKAAIETTTTKLNREHGFKDALKGKDHESIVNRSDDKIAYLEKELEAAAKANAALQEKLDRAYAELRELATKTVESASGVKIIGGSGTSGDQRKN